MLWFYRLFFPVAWIAFLLYWQIMWSRLLGTKATQVLEPRSSRMLRVLILLLAIVLLSTDRIPVPLLNHSLWPSGYWSFWAGAAVLVGGLVFAIWARRHLGSNWSSAVTIKQGHDLITSGPYGQIRHPIYTGILIGFLGSAIALTEVRGFLALAVVFFGFWLKLRREENWMRSQFGESYLIYKQKTAALIPHLF